VSTEPLSFPFMHMQCILCECCRQACADAGVQVGLTKCLTSFEDTTLGHTGDCLRHLLDPRQDGVNHRRFLSNSLVSFRSAEGKPALHSRAAVPAAFAYYSNGDPQARQHAYMKVVVHACACSLPIPASETMVTICRWGVLAVCVQRNLCRHVHAAQRASVMSIKYEKQSMPLRQCLSMDVRCSSALSANTTHPTLWPAIHIIASWARTT